MRHHRRIRAKLDKAFAQIPKIAESSLHRGVIGLLRQEHNSCADEEVHWLDFTVYDTERMKVHLAS